MRLLIAFLFCLLVFTAHAVPPAEFSKGISTTAVYVTGTTGVVSATQVNTSQVSTTTVNAVNFKALNNQSVFKKNTGADLGNFDGTGVGGTGSFFFGSNGTTTGLERVQISASLIVGKNGLTAPSLYVSATNGFVGMGTSAPSTALEVAGTVSATNFVGNGSGLTGIAAAPSGTAPSLQYNNSGTFGGAVGLGWNSGTSVFTASTTTVFGRDPSVALTSISSPTVYIRANSAATGNALFIENQSGAVPGTLGIGRFDSAGSIGAAEVVWQISAIGNDSLTNSSPTTVMSGLAPAAWTSSSHPMALRFSTTPVGGTSAPNRMVIDASGTLCISCTGNVGAQSTVSSSKLVVSGYSSFGINAPVNAMAAVDAYGLVSATAVKPSRSQDSCAVANDVGSIVQISTTALGQTLGLCKAIGVVMVYPSTTQVISPSAL